MFRHLSGIRLFVPPLLFSLTVTLISAAPVWAQTSASVGGTVVDPLGRPVAGAAVSLVREGQSVKAGKTDADGRFDLSVTDAGRYELEVSAPGFVTRTLEPFFVRAGARATRAVTLSVGFTQAVVVTASATETPASQVAAAVTVIDRATLDTLAKPSVLDALRLVPGVHVVQAGARGAATSLFVRGGNSTFNKVLVDGVAVNDIGGGFDFADLSTTGVERIEVLRDANSLLHGTDALSGVVDVTTRRGQTRTPEVTYSGDAGSFATQRHDLSIGGAAQRLDYFAAFSNFDTDNAVANSAHRNRTLVSQIGVAAGAHTEITAVFRAGDVRTGLPGAVSFFGLSDDSVKTADSQLFTIASQSQLSPRWKSTMRYAVTRSSYHTVNPSPTGQAFDPFGFGANYIGKPVTITGANGYSVSGQAILDYGGAFPTPYDARTTRQLGSGQATFRARPNLSLTAGVRVEHEDGYSQYSTSAPSASTRTNSGAFVEGQGTFGRIAATAGFGIDRNAVFGTAATPRVSLTAYLRTPSSASGIGDTKLTMNAGSGIKAASVAQELASLFLLVPASVASATGITAIGPERSRSFDVGVDQGLWGGRVRTRAAFFHNQFNDLIEYVSKSALVKVGVPADAAAATAFGAYVNASSYRARGLELSSEAHVAGLRLLGSYTFVDAVVTKSFQSSALAPAFNPSFPGVQIGAYSPLVGARPFRRPTHVGSLMAAYAAGPVELALSAYFSGKQDDSTFLSDQFFGNSLLLPNGDLDASYQKVDVSAGYRLQPHVRWYLSIENLTGQAYEPSAGIPALGRVFRTGLTLRIGGDAVKRP